MEENQIKFKIIRYKSDEYHQGIQIRSSINGKSIDNVQIELEKYWIHIAALKGDLVLAIGAIKPIKNNCEIKFCLFHSSVLNENQFILNGMLRLCQRIGLFYDFDEMFFARDEQKIMINLDHNLLGTKQIKQYSPCFKVRLLEKIEYILQNKSSLMDYEVHFYLENFEQFMGATSNEFVRGALSALMIRFEFEHKQRKAIEEATYGDILNILDDINVVKAKHPDILGIFERDVLAPILAKQMDKVLSKETLYIDAMNLFQYADRGTILAQHLLEKSVAVSETEGLWHVKALSLLFIKTQDLLKAKKCSNIDHKSINVVNDFWARIIESARLLSNKKYQDSIAILNQINLDFIAAEIVRNSNAKYKESIDYEMWEKLNCT